jgi:hypothetical protein
MLPSLYVLLFFECLPFAMWGEKPAANVTFGLIFEVYYWFWFIITWCFTPNSDQSLFTEILNSKFEFRVFFLYIYRDVKQSKNTWKHHQFGDFLPFTQHFQLHSQTHTKFCSSYFEISYWFNMYLKSFFLSREIQY